jgi:group II intron reverse transcriptase/maturase
MQRAEVVLSILRKESRQSPEYVFDRLYRNLFNPDFYMLAYSNLHAKEGNITPGTDGKTIDGFNIKQIEGLIGKLRNETYYPNPSKRTYRKKKNGKLRPLGIPSFSDKLVQEVLRMILEAIYEPIFKETSHGFRPGKSCHTALLEVKTTCKGVTWVVEGDIKGFFDNIDHDVLLSLISKKIADGRIIELLRRFLKAGYLEFHQVKYSLTGTPQGNVISPILANIYLHEIDKFMEERCRHYSTNKKSKRQNPEYHKLNNCRYQARKKGDYGLADKLLADMRKLPAHDPMDPGYIRVKYVRYADDFLILVNGSKQLAQTLKTEAGSFLRDKLRLELSEEKTLITHLATERVRFLGYEISKSQENSAVTKDSIGRTKRTVNGTIQLLVPGDVINNKLQKFRRDKKPIARPERVNDSPLNTLTVYNAEIQGLYNYYRLATDVSTKLNKFKHYHYGSLLKTIAQKEKTHISKVLKKHGVTVSRKQGTGTRKIFGVSYATKDGLHTRTYFNEPLRKMDTPCPGKGADGIAVSAYTPRHQIIDRYNAKKCELCGLETDNQGDFEIHHVRRLKDIKQKYAKRGAAMPQWVLKMAALSRKTLVVCKSCHTKVHRGEMNKSLKETMSKGDCAWN